MDDTERCAATHNPGVWPYAARCTRPVGHPGDDITGTDHSKSVHIDKDGRSWPVTRPPLPLPTPGTRRCHRTDEHQPHSWVGDREGRKDNRPWWVRIEECSGVEW